MANQLDNFVSYLPKHPDAHWQLLKKEVLEMIHSVALYENYLTQELEKAQTAEEINVALSHFPIITKKEIRLNFPNNLLRKGMSLNTALQQKEVELLTTSGSTGESLQVILDNGWWDKHLKEAISLNSFVKGCLASSNLKSAVLTTPLCSSTDCHLDLRHATKENRMIDGFLYLNRSNDPAHWSREEFLRIIDEWNELQPDWVEADPAYLAILCRFALQHNIPLHSPKFITLTYELPTLAHKRVIKSLLDSQLMSMYGATEAGVLFMECSQGYLHHNANHSHIELVEVAPGFVRPIVTTLTRSWMPLLRYDLPDILKISKSQHCPCGLPVEGYLIERVEGRLTDSMMVDNRLITPAVLDDEINWVEPEIEAWQLVLKNTANKSTSGQQSVLRVINSSGKKAAQALENIVHDAIKPIVVSALQPENSGKYRLVRYE